MNCLKNKKAFGGAASTLILFIAIITVSTGLVIAFQNFAQDTNSALKKQNDLTVNRIKTSLDITHIYYDTGLQTLYIYVKNIGSTDLMSKNFDVFVDNYFSHNLTAFLAENKSVQISQLKSQETIMFKLEDVVIEEGTHSVKVISEFGVGDEEDFNVS